MTERKGSVLDLKGLARGIWKRRGDVTAVSVYGYATIGLTFFIQVCVVRLLGQAEFGIYAATLAVVSFVEVPLIVRGSELALRVLGRLASASDYAAVRWSARRMILADVKLYSLSVVGLLALAWTLPQDISVNPWLMSILGLVIPAQAGFGVFKGYFIIFNRVREIVRYELAYTLLLAGLNIAGVLIGGVYGLAASLVLAAMVKTGLAYWWTRDYFQVAPQGAEDLAAKGQATESGVSILRNVFANGLNHVDVILVGMFQRPEHVAIYKVGKSLASLPIKVGLPAWRYLQPKLLSAVLEGNTRKEKAVVVAGSTVMAATLLVILPVAYWLGEPFLGMVYGEKYAAAFATFMALLVGIWMFHGVAGWFKFWAGITPSRWFALWVYGLMLASTVLLGVGFGGGSPAAMAYVVAAVLIAATFVCYVQLWRRS